MLHLSNVNIIRRRKSFSLAKDPTLTAAVRYSIEEKNVFTESSKTELAGQFQSLQMTSMPSGKLPLFGVALTQEAETICTRETVDDHHLLISYETITESSYSEVIMRTVSFSRPNCYEITSSSTSDVQDMDFDEFNPLDYGFTVVDISKGEDCFVTSTMNHLLSTAITINPVKNLSTFFLLSLKQRLQNV